VSSHRRINEWWLGPLEPVVKDILQHFAQWWLCIVHRSMVFLANEKSILNFLPNQNFPCHRNLPSCKSMCCQFCVILVGKVQRVGVYRRDWSSSTLSYSSPRHHHRLFNHRLCTRSNRMMTSRRKEFHDDEELSSSTTQDSGHENLTAPNKIGASIATAAHLLIHEGKQHYAQLLPAAICWAYQGTPPSSQNLPLNLFMKRSTTQLNRRYLSPAALCRSHRRQPSTSKSEYVHSPCLPAQAFTTGCPNASICSSALCHTLTTLWPL